MDIGEYKKILIFAGTSEGHELARYLKKIGHLDDCVFCVATDYGEMVLKDVPGADVRTGRLGEEEIRTLIASEGFCAVIDSTHPFAVIVTENIKKAASQAGIEYIRLVRDDGTLDEYTEKVTYADSTEEAIELLNQSNSRFLLTTGAKELSKYGKIKNFSDRAVARVLPSHMSIDACLEAGLEGKNVIAMQGPFTREMNIATMKQYGLDTLVTKSTGKAGGFEEKVSLTREGYNVLIIGRRENEDGLSLKKVLERLSEIYE